MNGADFNKERSSLQLLGKEFIIVVVVVFSALSFTLGYFVGKSGIEKKPGMPLQTTMPEPQKPQPQTPPEPPVADNTPQSAETPKEVVQTQPKEPFVIVESKQPVSKETIHKPAVKDVKDSPVSAKSAKSDEPLYAIQLGAFKSSDEAEIFRKKHTQEGLKTYIITTTNSRKEKIYKVKTGEFKDRKKAEVLSLKLNKTEKLKTFITLRNE